MKEFVDIEISGSHLRYDENDPIAVNISGNHYIDGDIHKITYVEEAQGFDEIILNTIIVNKNRVEIIKEGVVNSKMYLPITVGTKQYMTLPLEDWIWKQRQSFCS